MAFFAVSASLTNSAAADTVNWRQFEGTSITWAYDIHPYADALAAQLPEFEKLTRHQGHAGTLPRRFLLEQDDDPTDDEVASMGCVRHWHSARVGPRSEWRPGAAGQIPERSEAYRCSIRLHYVDMIKKCAAPSFANDNWYQVVDGISSGRTAMTIDSNMFGFWNDVAGKPASGKIAFAPPLHAPSATSLDSDIWIWALAMNAASEKKGTAWLFIPWATSKQVALKGALACQLVNPPRTSTWQDDTWTKYASQPEFNNFVDSFKKIQDHAALAFTPRVGFGEAMNAWAVAMQKMVNGDDVETTLRALAEEIRTGL
ncbi:extracellular solute-binding protein [Mesorhizobium sp.]|uniref:extracellular solute-binding protein n=1 Tax=Mesorhizobium sp. TaxID=1871066 RepID=UPI0025D451EB|nr:extracellular solute-binding protein [Mesorhizobium sp.]